MLFLLSGSKSCPVSRLLSACRGLGFRVSGLGFRVSGLGFRVQGVYELLKGAGALKWARV